MTNKYKNRRGQDFTIKLLTPDVPDHADYWGYGYQVGGPDEKNRTFRVLILRSLLADEPAARLFAENADPLKELFCLLENYDVGETPLLFPDLRKGWAVF